MRRTIFAALSALALTACQPQDPEGAPATPPADAPTDIAVEATPFDPPLKALGTEPFWAVELTEQTITLTRPDVEPLSMANPGMRMDGARATWDALSAGARIYMVAEEKPCSDGMSDNSYPLTVEVRTGELTLKGCGAKSAEMPRGG